MAKLANNKPVTKYTPPKSINGGTQAPKSAAPKPKSNPRGLVTPKGFNAAYSAYEANPGLGSVPNTSGSTSAAAAATPVTPAYNPPSDPNDPFAFPEFHGSAAEDPRDSVYWSALSKLQFSDRTQYAENLAEQSKNNADYGYAKQQALVQHGVDQRHLGESLLSNGLQASGFHDREEAEGTRQYTEEGAHRDLNHNEELAGLAAARKALIEGYGIEQAALLGEAAGRKAQALAEEAANSAPEPEAPPPAPGPTPAAKTQVIKNTNKPKSKAPNGNAIGNAKKAK